MAVGEVIGIVVTETAATGTAVTGIAETGTVPARPTVTAATAARSRLALRNVGGQDACPTELQATIMQTFAEAKEEVMDKAAAALAPILPEGMDAAAMVRGKAGVDMFLPPEGPRMTSGVREMLGLGPEKP